MARWIIAITLSILVTLAGGCGSKTTAPNNGTSATATTQVSSRKLATVPVNEDALAKSVLLTVSDFPAGWAEKPSTNASSSVANQCNAAPSAGQTGYATTGDFSKGGTARVSEEIVVFATASDTSAALDRASQRPDCRVKLINEGKADDTEVALSGASLSPVSFPQIGDRTAAYRLEFHLKVKSQMPTLINEADGYVDFVFVLIGRVEISLGTIDVFSPFDTQQLQQLASVAVAKVQTGVGQATATKTPQ